MRFEPSRKAEEKFSKRNTLSDRTAFERLFVTPKATGSHYIRRRRKATVKYLFSVAVGILPAVEPGILPGGMGVWFERPLPLRISSPGGKMPPSTAAKMAAATTRTVR